MARFDNPTLRHRTRQIAMDGSQKLPQRLLAPIAARLEAGRGIDALALAVAAWICWQAGRDDSGASHQVDDPLAGAMAALLANRQSSADRVAAILAFDAVMPPSLARDDRLRAALTHWLAILETDGARRALTAFSPVTT
jgi:fructuronate reductase